MSDKMIREVQPKDEVVITEREKIAAMANDPEDSEDFFVFNGKQYPVMHLKYKDYMTYLATIQPVIGSVLALLSPKAEEDMELASIVMALAEVLPGLVRLSIKQSDSTVSLRYVEENAQSPFELLDIIAKQVKKNAMVEDFRRFFDRYQTMIPNDLQSKLTI